MQASLADLIRRSTVLNNEINEGPIQSRGPGSVHAGSLETVLVQNPDNRLEQRKMGTCSLDSAAARYP